MQATQQSRARHPRSFGFTLVEMLVVITIIGILAAILIPTIGSVLRGGKLNAMAVEINNISQALEAYKLENKDYPPDFSNTTAVVNHVRTAFPRNTFNIGNFINSAPGAGQPDPRRLDQAEALVFWLSKLKNNPRNPFTGTGEDKIYFEFKPDQLTDVDNDGWPEYAAKHAQGVPYVYFDGRVQNDAGGQAAVCAYAWSVYPAPWSPASPSMAMALRFSNIGRSTKFPSPADLGFGVARPYRTNNAPSTSEKFTFPITTTAGVNNTGWHAPRKFQIISAGLDQAFGSDQVDSNGVPVYKCFPAPNYYISSGDFSEDADNVCNFTESQTIGDAVP